MTQTLKNLYWIKEDSIMQLAVVNGQVGEGVKFQRIRRITGYLVGTLDRFNDAKASEERDRVRHDIEYSKSIRSQGR